MKKIWIAAPLALALNGAMAADGALQAEFKQMMERSFQGKGIAEKARIHQLDFQAACSGTTPAAEQAQAMAEAQLATVKYPADGHYFGDWQRGEKIAISGRGLTWRDEADAVNGGGCYNCHQLSHHEIAYGTIGPSLLEYGAQRGDSEEVVRYTWAKLWNAKAFNICSNMPRNGDAGILTTEQIKDVMAYLFDPASPVNKP